MSKILLIQELFHSHDNMARDFSGVNQTIQFGSLFQNVSVFSISVWVQLDVINVDQSVIATFRNGSTGFMLFFDDIGISANDVWSFVVADSGNTGTVRLECSASSGTTNLTHLYAEFTATTTGGFRVFINGVADANSPANTTGGNGDDSGGSGNSLTLGCDSTGTTRDLNGRIAEVGIWTRTLGDSEIAGLAKGYSPLFYPQSLDFYSPLIGNFSPEVDLIGASAGTVTGATKFTHPRIIYPSPKQLLYIKTVVAPGGNVIKDVINSGIIPFAR